MKTISKTVLVATLVLVCLLVTISSVTGQVTFKNVQPKIGAAFQVYPNCAAWGDVDNDGDLDVYMSQGSKMGNDLMINDLNKSGKFLRGDTLAGVFIRSAGPRAVVMVDIDNDGDQDIMAIDSSSEGWKTYLCLNQLTETGSLWFKDVSDATGITHLNESYYCINVADYNNDGKLDIFIAGLSSTAWTPSLLLKNTTANGGPLSFEDDAESAGIYSMLGMDMACGSWADYDNDGDQDILIPTMPTWPVFFYRNEGNGTFTEISETNGLSASVGSSRAAIWADYDNDGDLDVYITRCVYIDKPNMDNCELWRNDNGYFTEVPSARVVGKEIRGAAWGDYDNDGDQDLHLLEGSKVDILFRNDGNDVFVNVVDAVGLAKTESPGGWGLMDINDRGGETWADWDADGDLDLLLPGGDGTKPFLMQNNGGNAKNWLEVRLTGVTSNRNAIGARVIVVAEGLRQLREVCMGNGYLCGSPTDCHFGLAAKSIIDSLIIKWPSGTVDVYTRIGVNQIMKIVEGNSTSGVAREETLTPKNFVLHQNYPNPFNPTTCIRYDLPEALYVSLTIYNLRGEEILSLVENEFQTAGSHTVTWNGHDLADNFVPTGIYTCKLQVGESVTVRKMVLMK